MPLHPSLRREGTSVAPGDVPENTALRLHENAALVVVDAQISFDDPWWGPRNNVDADRNIIALADAFAASGRPLIYVRHALPRPRQPPAPDAPREPAQGVPDPRPELEVHKTVNYSFHGHPGPECLAVRARHRPAGDRRHHHQPLLRDHRPRRRQPRLRRPLPPRRDPHLPPRRVGVTTCPASARAPGPARGRADSDQYFVTLTRAPTRRSSTCSPPQIFRRAAPCRRGFATGHRELPVASNSRESTRLWKAFGKGRWCTTTSRWVGRVNAT
jgi:hypothetical protein